MKKYVLFVVMLLCATVALAQGPEGKPGIIVQDIKYEPYPANPGHYVDVWLKIENFGDIDANGFTVELRPKYPFSLDPGDNATKTFGKILSHQAVLVKYTVRIDENAVEGETLLHYAYKHDGQIRWQDSDMTIFIRTSDANIAVNSIMAERIAPGAVSPVAIELENMADSTLTDVNVKLGLTGSDLPFVPINSTSEKKIYKIVPGEKATALFYLMALPDAVSNTYKIPIEITFKDGTGANYTKNSIIGLLVGANPDLSIVIDKSEIYKKGDTGNIVLKFINKGLSDIKLMNIVMQPSKNYDIISGDEVYVGKIDSDDYETAEFRLKINKVKSGFAELYIDMEYLDSNNIKYKETRLVELKVVTAKKLGIAQSNPLYRLIGIVAVVGIGYFIYRRWEKRKSAKK